MRPHRAVALSPLVLCLIPAAVAARPAPAPALARDLASYATASCLAAQPEALLRDQGERWASAVVQRGAGPPEAWTPVATAVGRELARNGVALGKSEPQMPAVRLTLMTCGEIADTATVRDAIKRAKSQLSRYYSGRAR